MENVVKDRMVYFINKTIRKFDSGDFNFNTNEGKVVNIEEDKVTIRLDDSVYLFMNLDKCRISTLCQIVEGLKCELEYIRIEKIIKKKTDHFDDKKKIWTHKPIDRNFLLERIRLKLRNRKLSKNVVRLSKVK